MKSLSPKAYLAGSAIAIGAILVTLLLTMTYVSGALNGKFDHIFLPAKMFGIPEKVAGHGYDLLFKDDQDGGWDGQFYYYIANDPFALRDTPSHVDSDAYRYQRVGLPILAYFVSKITGSDWVSPLTYYATSLAILFLATLLGAFFLSSRGLSPWWILLWTLGMGPQITQLHGLPDGAADGLLIVALICLLDQRKTLYTLAITFAALSREIYVIVPCALVFADWFIAARQTGIRQQLRTASLMKLAERQWFQLIPLVIFVAWQIFVRTRFHIAPSAQAANVLGFPLKAALKYMFAPEFGLREWNRGSRVESAGIVLFLAVLGTTAWKLICFVRRFLTEHQSPDPIRVVQLGIAFAFLPVVALYFCFGTTVMMDNTGYWKAANIFLFIIPLLAAMEFRGVGRWSCTLSVLCSALFGMSLLWHVNSSLIESEQINFATQEPTCLKHDNSRIRPISVEVIRGNWWQRLVGNTTYFINGDITNTGDEDFLPYRGKGGMSVRYQWINRADGSVAKDGLGGMLRDRLGPGNTVRLPIRVEVPSSKGDYLLKVRVVQEKCLQFDAISPTNGFDMEIVVR